MACEYIIKDDNGNDVVFKDQKSLVDYIKKNQLYNRIPVKGTPQKTTSTLANILRQMSFGEQNYSPNELKSFQQELLDDFIKIEDQSQFFYKLGPAIALTKGMGKGFETVDTIKRNLRELGVGKSELPEGVPFDARYLLTGDSQYKVENASQYYHKLTANNIKKAYEIDALARTMFMERTPSFLNISDKVVANLDDRIQDKKIKEMRDELSAFVQIAAYKQWIQLNDKRTSTLRNSLIYDTEGNLPTIIDIANEAIQFAPNNGFLKFILPVSTTIKTSKKKQKNILNRDLINTIEGKTRGRLEPDLISNMMDSFTELYENPETRFHAKALFDYLIVKDGLMFKNKSFIKLVPALMFKDVSDATAISTKLMAANTADEFKRILKELATITLINKEGNETPYFSNTEKQAYNDMFRKGDLMAVKNTLYQRVFGMGYNKLYHKFEEIYATDVRNQFNLELIKPKIRNAKGITKTAEGLTFAKDENGEYLHVELFTQKFRDSKEDSDERKNIFKATIDELGNAGFLIKSLKDDEKGNKNYIQFKKFIRIRAEAPKGLPGEYTVKSKAKYNTYQLISVNRDKGSFTQESMTPIDSDVPYGTYGVYKLVEPVGTPNSTGVADLGKRPTKDEVLATIEAKLKKDDDNNAPPAAPLVPNQPTTPTSPSTVLPMEPDNIEKVKQGIKTITNRTKKLEDGTYTMPDGTNVNIKLLGEGKVFVIRNSKGEVQERGVHIRLGSSAEDWNADRFAKAEGFKDWNDFEKNNKFSKNFVNGTQARYIYSIELQSNTLQGGIFGGLQEFPSTQDFDMSNLPPDFFSNDISEDDINDALNNLDKC
jgi:hypothetical protein